MSENRKSAMLTESQRKVLADESGDLTDSGERKSRARARQRIRRSFEQFSLVYDKFNQHDMNEVFGDIDQNPELRRGVRNALAFIIHGTIDMEFAPTVDLTDSGKDPQQVVFGGWFDNFLEEAFALELLKYYDFVLNEYEPPQLTGERIEGLHRARTIAESGGELSPRFIMYLLMSGVLENDSIQEEIRSQILDHFPSQEEKTE